MPPPTASMRLQIAEVTERAIRILRDSGRPNWVADIVETLESWRPDVNVPFVKIIGWVAGKLRALGLFETEIEICRLALLAWPAHAVFQFRLAMALQRSGKSSAARQILKELKKPLAVRREVLFAWLANPDERPRQNLILSQIEALLIEDGEWTDRHHTAFVRFLVNHGGLDRARSFFTRWTGRWPSKPDQFWAIAESAVLLELYPEARRLYARIWPNIQETARDAVGRLDLPVPAYDERTEGELLRRIEAAFANPPLASKWSCAGAPALAGDGPRILFVTRRGTSVPNDLAEHFLGSAAASGVRLAIHADDDLVAPLERIGHQSRQREKIAQFVDALSADPPDILVLDCYAPPQGGLDPEILVPVKHRLGFRLVALVRDAHHDNMTMVSGWLPFCDSMIVFDPGSPVFASDHAPLNEKVVCLPVPTMHGPFLERPPRSPGLIFIGSITFKLRPALLSRLLTEDLVFSAIFGAKRAELTPDTRSYALALSGAQAVLNISVHGPGIHLITGRVWETIAAGALLVEQKNPAVETLLTPYRHYLPWRTVGDILYIAQFIQNRPEQAKRIADEAHNYMAENFASNLFWGRLVQHALRPLPQRDAESETRAAKTWTPWFEPQHVADYEYLEGLADRLGLSLS